jgi:hypothetical protein
MRILVLADDDTDLRVAHALAGEPGVTIFIQGKAKSSRYPTVEDLSGLDVVVGRSLKTLDIAANARAGAVIAEDVDESPVPTVAGASLLGAALAVANRMEAEGSDILRVAIAQPGGPSRGGTGLTFPPPVGRSRGTVLMEAPQMVLSAASQAPWAALVVESNTGDQAVVDDHRFVSAVCLAAGIALVPPAGIVKVWDVPGPYLAKAEAMGMVAARRRDS